MKRRWFVACGVLLTLLVPAHIVSAATERLQTPGRAPDQDAEHASQAKCSAQALNFEVANGGATEVLSIRPTRAGGRFEISADNVALTVDFAWDPRTSFEDLSERQGNVVFGTASVNGETYYLGRVRRLPDGVFDVEFESDYRAFVAHARLVGGLDVVRQISQVERRDPEAAIRLASLSFVESFLDPDASASSNLLSSVVLDGVECVQVQPNLCLCWYCWTCIIWECCSVPTEYPGSCR